MPQFCRKEATTTSRRGFGLLAPWQKAPGRRIGVRGAELRDLVPSASAREGAKSEFSGTRFSIFRVPDFAEKGNMGYATFPNT